MVVQREKIRNKKNQPKKVWGGVGGGSEMVEQNPLMGISLMGQRKAEDRL